MTILRPENKQRFERAHQEAHNISEHLRKASALINNASLMYEECKTEEAIIYLKRSIHIIKEVNGTTLMKQLIKEIEG